MDKQNIVSNATIYESTYFWHFFLKSYMLLIYVEGYNGTYESNLASCYNIWPYTLWISYLLDW